MVTQELIAGLHWTEIYAIKEVLWGPKQSDGIEFELYSSYIEIYYPSSLNFRRTAKDEMI